MGGNVFQWETVAVKRRNELTIDDHASTWMCVCRVNCHLWILLPWNGLETTTTMTTTLECWYFVCRAQAANATIWKFVWVEWNYVRAFSLNGLNYRLESCFKQNHRLGDHSSDKALRKHLENSARSSIDFAINTENACKLQMVSDRSMRHNSTEHRHTDTSNTCSHSMRSNHVHVYGMMFDSARGQL